MDALEQRDKVAARMDSITHLTVQVGRSGCVASWLDGARAGCWGVLGSGGRPLRLVVWVVLCAAQSRRLLTARLLSRPAPRHAAAAAGAPLPALQLHRGAAAPRVLGARAPGRGRAGDQALVGLRGLRPPLHHRRRAAPHRALPQVRWPPCIRLADPASLALWVSSDLCRCGEEEAAGPLLIRCAVLCCAQVRAPRGDVQDGEHVPPPGGGAGARAERHRLPRQAPPTRPGAAVAQGLGLARAG